MEEGRWRRRDRRTLEERRAASAQATKLLPSRSRCTTEVGCSPYQGPRTLETPNCTVSLG